MRIVLSGRAELARVREQVHEHLRRDAAGSPRITGTSFASCDLDALAALLDQRLDQVARRDRRRRRSTTSWWRMPS